MYQVARSDKSQTDLITGYRFLCLRIVNGSIPFFFIFFIIFQKNADITLMIRVLRDHLISFCCLSKGNLMGNDIGKTDSFLSKQTDKLLDIATFCEAHIADR